jgi:hypothetical protein
VAEFHGGRIDTVTTVVRGFGYEVTHVVTVPTEILLDCSWLKSGFTGIPTPVAARCTKQIRSVQDVVVMMEVGTPVKCKDCVRWTGIVKQTEDTYTPIHVREDA